MISPTALLTLITRSRQGDTQATEVILQHLEPLIRQLAKSWAPSIDGYEPEDLEQEGRLEALWAVTTWDPEKAPLESWTRQLITHRLTRLLDEQKAEKRGSRYTSISLSQPMGWDAEAGQPLLLGDLIGIPGPEDAVVDRLELEARLAPMTARQQAVARLLMLYYSQTEIASTLDISIDAVRHARAQIARLLVEEG